MYRLKFKVIPSLKVIIGKDFIVQMFRVSRKNLPPSNVDSAVPAHPSDGLLVVLPEGGLPPAPLQPLLQQVLVVGVAPGPQGDGAPPKLPTAGVDPDRHEAVRLVEAVDVAGHPGGGLLVPGVAGGLAQGPELQLDASHLQYGAGWSLPSFGRPLGKKNPKVRVVRSLHYHR